MFSVQPPPPPGSETPPGVTSSEKGKFVLLFVAFLVILGTMGLLAVLSQFDDAPPEDGANADPEAAAATEGVGGLPQPVVEIQPQPLFPEEQAERIEARLHEELAALPGIIDGEPKVDARAFEFLLREVTTNPRILNLSTEGFRRDVDTTPLLAEPAVHRGKLVEVRGEVLALETLPFEGESELVKELRRGLVRDAAGRFWTFTQPVANPLEEFPVAPGAGWVRLYGVFYKPWRIADPDGGADPVASLHVILQRDPAPDFEPVAIRDIDPAWFGQVSDATTAEQMIRDQDPLFYLLNMAITLGPDGFVQWAEEKQAESPELKIWPPEDFTDRSEVLKDNPDAHRFRTVSYTGYLARPTRILNIRPNPGNIDKVWHAFLVDTDHVPIWILAPRSFVADGFEHEERVTVEGWFYKRIAYTPRDGDAMLSAPVLVAARIRSTPLPEGMDIDRTVLVLALGLMLLLGGALFTAILQGRREDAAAQQARLDRAKRRRRHQAEGTSEAEASTGDADRDGSPPA